MPRKNPHAVALGRKGGKIGGRVKSDAKAAAARENGKRGGRPKLRRTRLASARRAGKRRPAGTVPRRPAGVRVARPPEWTCAHGTKMPALLHDFHHARFAAARTAGLLTH
jgi:general stress protein YciG